MSDLMDDFITQLEDEADLVLSIEQIKKIPEAKALFQAAIKVITKAKIKRVEKHYEYDEPIIDPSVSVGVECSGKVHVSHIHEDDIATLEEMNKELNRILNIHYT